MSQVNSTDSLSSSMDAIDLVIGSDGTLGVISELELALVPAPAVTWDVSCFFTAERRRGE